MLNRAQPGSVHRVIPFIPCTCPKASCYPLLYLVLRLWDKTHRLPSYLTHDPRSSPPPRPRLSALSGRCKGAARQLESSDISGTRGAAGGFHDCAEITHFPSIKHFSFCLEVIGMQVCTKVRRCCITSLVNGNLKSFQRGFCYEAEVVTRSQRSNFALGELSFSLAYAAETFIVLFSYICTENSSQCNSAL